MSTARSAGEVARKCAIGLILTVPHLAHLAPAKPWVAMAPWQGTGAAKSFSFQCLQTLLEHEWGIPWAQYGLQANLLWAEVWL